jgi:hypothetical protein
LQNQGSKMTASRKNIPADERTDLVGKLGKRYDACQTPADFLALATDARKAKCNTIADKAERAAGKTEPKPEPRKYPTVAEAVKVDALTITEIKIATGLTRDKVSSDLREMMKAGTVGRREEFASDQKNKLYRYCALYSRMAEKISPSDRAKADGYEPTGVVYANRTSAKVGANKARRNNVYIRAVQYFDAAGNERFELWQKAK